MNLFLLAAVPLAASAIHLAFYRDRPPFADPKSWIWGFVWSILSLVVVAFFGKAREFTGDIPWALAGLTFTDALLVPGVVLTAWVLTRTRHDPWELGLWLSLVLTLAGVRDFAATSRMYDLNELFLVPLDRILLILTVPALVSLALRSVKSLDRSLWAAAALGLVLTGSVFPILSFAGWGWSVWVLLTTGIGVALWLKKKAAPQGSGHSN